MLVFTPELLVAFVLVFARVAGVVAFVPFPGSGTLPSTPKIALALLLTLVLLPLASAGDAAAAGPWTIAAGVLRETGFGIAVGLALHIVAEMLGLAAQMLGFQAGYSYINTIDPATQVDATILNVLLTLLGGLLFFSFDLHLHIVRALARSLELAPLGNFHPTPAQGLYAIRLGGAMFELAVRLAFPIVAVLLLVDLALALLSYINARMQLLTLSFPLKMLVTMASLYVVVRLAPRLYQELARQAMGMVSLVARGAARGL